jgi:hypothetical protein
MKLFTILYILSVTIILGCNQSDKQTSKSYKEIEDFLKQAKIEDPTLIFFYKGNPRMPLPNVYCFDSSGSQINTPPQCFGYIKEYITLLGDSVMPITKNGQHLSAFIDSIQIMDAFDSDLKVASLPKKDYYLFIDFISISEPSFMKTLYDAVKYSFSSSKKIKLFLVHALSEKNAKYFKKKFR